MKQCIMKIRSATINAEGLILDTGITSKTIRNGCLDAFCIGVDLPVTTSVVPVFLQIGNTEVPVQDMIGNTLQSDQIKCRTLYRGVWGTNPTHFRLVICTPRSQATNKTIALDEA